MSVPSSEEAKRVRESGSDISSEGLLAREALCAPRRHLPSFHAALASRRRRCGCNGNGDEYIIVVAVCVLLSTEYLADLDASAIYHAIHLVESETYEFCSPAGMPTLSTTKKI